MINWTTENRNFRAFLQYAGLKSAGIGATLGRNLFGGIGSMQAKGSPYTDVSTLKIHQGGLRDRKLKATFKNYFREEVMPFLKTTFPEMGKKSVDVIELHFNDGYLSDIKLVH